MDSTIIAAIIGAIATIVAAMLAWVKFQGRGEKGLVVSISNDLETFEKIIERRDWEATRENPAFRKFIRSCYQQEVEELDNYTRALFWEDLSAYLDRVKEREKSFEQIRLTASSEEFKALFPKIDKARHSFDYDAMDQVLLEFEEQHELLIRDLGHVFFLRAQYYEKKLLYHKAERYYRKATAIEDQNPEYFQAFASILAIIGLYREGEFVCRQALAIKEKALGSEHPDVAVSLNCILKFLT